MDVDTNSAPNPWKPVPSKILSIGEVVRVRPTSPRVSTKFVCFLHHCAERTLAQSPLSAASAAGAWFPRTQFFRLATAETGVGRLCLVFQAYLPAVVFGSGRARPKPQSLCRSSKSKNVLGVANGLPIRLIAPQLGAGPLNQWPFLLALLSQTLLDRPLSDLFQLEDS